MIREYEPWTPGANALRDIEHANSICAEYAAQGYDLTLRQLYYQFVSRDLIPNDQRSYKRLGDVVNRARMAGLLDWDYITDRTRNLRRLFSWRSPGQLLMDVTEQYKSDLWQDQPTRVEVWVEKEALAGVIERVADAHDCPWFSCRGYVSQSEMHEAAMRIVRRSKKGQRTLILHLGDHDPSGIDMTRDITDRLTIFTEEHYAYDSFEVNRIALNMDQIELYQPPPNPAKLTDSRSDSYLARFGDESWELDALEPAVLSSLVEQHVKEVVDQELMDAAEARDESARDRLRGIAEQFGD